MIFCLTLPRKTAPRHLKLVSSCRVAPSTPTKHAKIMKADELIIDKIKDIARSTVPDGSEAILYGSRARGDARSDSDWDILILLNKDTLTQNDYDNVSYPFVMLGCNLGAEINPILYTKKEWETYQFTPFYENVNRDGIILA